MRHLPARAQFGRKPWRAFVCAVLSMAAATGLAAQAGQTLPRNAADARPSAPLAEALGRAGANRAELERALRDAPPAQAEGMRFLIENMPDRDLRSLSAAFLLENTALAYEALDRAPWKDRIPKRIFLNDVLPYACLTEPRDRTRKLLRDTAAPLLTGCILPGEAAHQVNQKLFQLLKARYSLDGTRPDQGVAETLESGKATCIGLSVVLVAACRSVGIPARLAGIPLWPDNRGTHEWVEVWDGGWHFMGAAEAYSEGLDYAWFISDAAKALRDVPAHAIYATSFAKTGLFFPMIWAPEVRWVPAVNVTDRYKTGGPQPME